MSHLGWAWRCAIKGEIKIIVLRALNFEVLPRCVDKISLKVLLGLVLLMCSANGFSQVFINEVFVQPAADPVDPVYQSMADCLNPTVGEEWVEIYNASLCDTIDIGCYRLASNTSTNNQMTFAFPAGTRIAPLDFIVVGGAQAPGVDFVVSNFCGQSNFCGTNHWMLENDFGWIALYSSDGTTADAVYWTATGGQPGQLSSNSAYSGVPCVPPQCSSGSPKAANQMSPGSEILYAGKAPAAGLSLYRQLDGTGGWQTDGSSTPGVCNGPCATPSTLKIEIDSFSNERCLQSNGWISVNITGGISPYDIDWSIGSSADSIEGLSAGNYSALVTDDLGCNASTSITLINIGTPVSVNIDPPISTIFRGESVQLNLNTAAVLNTIIWTPATTLSCGDCAAPFANPTTVTNYTVVVTDNDGCTGNATATVNVLSDENSTFIPTAFTPNNDNENDVLFVRSPKLSGLEFHVYDRWGREVFFTSDQTTGWDGRDKNGKEVENGIYVYYAVVGFDNGKSKVLKGNVAVLR